MLESLHSRNIHFKDLTINPLSKNSKTSEFKLPVSDLHYLEEYFKRSLTKDNFYQYYQLAYYAKILFPKHSFSITDCSPQRIAHSRWYLNELSQQNILLSGEYLSLVLFLEEECYQLIVTKNIEHLNSYTPQIKDKLYNFLQKYNFDIASLPVINLLLPDLKPSNTAELKRLIQERKNYPPLYKQHLQNLEGAKIFCPNLVNLTTDDWQKFYNHQEMLKTLLPTLNKYTPEHGSISLDSFHAYFTHAYRLRILSAESAKFNGLDLDLTFPNNILQIEEKNIPLRRKF